MSQVPRVSQFRAPNMPPIDETTAHVAATVEDEVTVNHRIVAEEVAVKVALPIVVEADHTVVVGE